jgi:hypothetical protein
VQTGQDALAQRIRHDVALGSRHSSLLHEDRSSTARDAAIMRRRRDCCTWSAALGVLPARQRRGGVRARPGSRVDAAALACTLIALASWRATHGEKEGAPDHLLDNAEGRSRFMAASGFVLGIIFMVAIAVGSMPPLYFDAPCR